VCIFRVYNIIYTRGLLNDGCGIRRPKITPVARLHIHVSVYRYYVMINVVVTRDGFHLWRGNNKTIVFLMRVRIKKKQLHGTVRVCL
jgi:hypothetical protein